MKCVDCGSEAFRETVRQDEFVVGDRVYCGQVPAQACAKCGTVYVTARAQLAFERGIGLHLAEHGPVDGPGLAFLRALLRMRAGELAKLLHVRAETLSRWERGHVEVDRNAWVVVGDLLRDLVDGREDTRARLGALARPHRARRVDVSVPLARGG